MIQVVPLILPLMLWPLEAAAGLFGPSPGEVMPIMLAVIFGIPAFVAVIAFYLRAKVKLAEQKARPSLTPGNSRFDIFLSYSAKDGFEAKQLSQLIQQSQLKVFFAQKDLEGGSPFTEEIRAALNDSREVWVLATLNSIDSVWVATEWGTAWALQRRIVPILLNATSERLPDRLRALHAVDLSNVVEEIGKAQRRAQDGAAGANGKRSFSLWKKAVFLLIALFLLGWFLA